MKNLFKKLVFPHIRRSNVTFLKYISKTKIIVEYTFSEIEGPKPEDNKTDQNKKVEVLAKNEKEGDKSKPQKEQKNKKTDKKQNENKDKNEKIPNEKIEKKEELQKENISNLSKKDDKLEENIKVNVVTKEHVDEPKKQTDFISENLKKSINVFRTNWEKISIDNDEKKIEELGKNMSSSQKDYIQLLASKFLSFNQYKITYLNKIMKEKVLKTTGLTPVELQTDFKSLLDHGDNVSPMNPSYFKQQEIMSEFTNWLRSQAAPSTVQTIEKEEKKEIVEEKKEREFYDIELSSFDPAKKIVLIKEVRALLNLGLKEAKEFVEKAPVVILKKIKKVDFETLIAKLKENGGTFKLI